MKTKKMKQVWLLKGPFTKYEGGTDAVKELADENNLRIVDSRYVEDAKKEYPDAAPADKCPKVKLKEQPKKTKKES